MSYGLWKIHHAIQKEAAIRDWQSLVKLAREKGRNDLVEKYQYKESAGTRTIDRQAAKLVAALNAASVLTADELSELEATYSHV